MRPIVRQTDQAPSGITRLLGDGFFDPSVA
jgi:hypothetical protein